MLRVKTVESMHLVQIPVPPPTSVIPSMFTYPAMPQFPHLQTGDNVRVVCDVRDLTYV